MSKERKHEYLGVTDAKVGRQISFEGVVIEIVEVNEVKHPLGIPSTFTVAYRIRDIRQAPPFLSGVAHLFASQGQNLMPEFRKIKDHYEQIKSQLRATK